jgi:hypothetical protein
MATFVSAVACVRHGFRPLAGRIFMAGIPFHPRNGHWTWQATTDDRVIQGEYKI